MSILSKQAIAASIADYSVKKLLDDYTTVATVAAAGSLISDGTPLQYGRNIVTAADATKAVVLPDAKLNSAVEVVNTVANAALVVFPKLAGDQINAITAGEAFTQAAGSRAEYYCDAAGHWYVAAANLTGTATSSSQAELDYNNITLLGTLEASKTWTSDANLDTIMPTGGKLTVQSGGDVTLESGSTLDVAGTFEIANVAMTATAAELNDAADRSTQVLAAGTGFTAGVGALHYSSIEKTGTIIKTTIFIDLTGLDSSTTDLDIIGNSGTAAGAHIGQITAAKNGTIFYGQVTCLETPATGADDIIFYYADESTGAFDDAISGLTGATVMYDKTSAAAAAPQTPVAFVALPAADKYMYLVNGEAGTIGEYTAGQFLIELWGA